MRIETRTHPPGNRPDLSREARCEPQTPGGALSRSRSVARPVAGFEAGRPGFPRDARLRVSPVADRFGLPLCGTYNLPQTRESRNSDRCLVFALHSHFSRSLAPVGSDTLNRPDAHRDRPRARWCRMFHLTPRRRRDDHRCALIGSASGRSHELVLQVRPVDRQLTGSTPTGPRDRRGDRSGIDESRAQRCVRRCHLIHRPAFHRQCRVHDRCGHDTTRVGEPGHSGFDRDRRPDPDRADVARGRGV